MRKRIAYTFVLVLLLSLAFGVGYWSGFSQAHQGARIVVARDVADSQTSSAKTEYEPYFTKQNSMPDKVSDEVSPEY